MCPCLCQPVCPCVRMCAAPACCVWCACTCVHVFVCVHVCVCVSGRVCLCVHTCGVWYTLGPSAFQGLCVVTSWPPQEGGLVSSPHPISGDLSEASDCRAEPGRAPAGLRLAGPAGLPCFGDRQVALLAGRGQRS